MGIFYLKDISLNYLFYNWLIDFYEMEKINLVK